MKENINEEYASLALKRFYDTTTNTIQMSALVNRALTDKISTQTINQKVNNQLNSIYTSIYRINSKFDENSKNYEIVKREILDVLTDYENALTEFSDYYDLKLEKLILKKVELESHLVGKIFKEESLKMNEDKSIKNKDNDKLKISLSNRTKNIFEKINLNKKEDNYVNVENFSIMQDYIDLEKEQDKKINKRILKFQEKNKTNMAEIVGLENQIKKISAQIDEMNNNKKLQIESAMETREKWIAKTLRKPSVLQKAKCFFANKFTTSKVITKTIIAPLKIKINEFREKELQEIKR